MIPMGGAPKNNKNRITPTPQQQEEESNIPDISGLNQEELEQLRDACDAKIVEMMDQEGGDSIDDEETV